MYFTKQIKDDQRYLEETPFVIQYIFILKITKTELLFLRFSHIHYLNHL